MAEQADGPPHQREGSGSRRDNPTESHGNGALCAEVSYDITDPKRKFKAPLETGLRRLKVLVDACLMIGQNLRGFTSRRLDTCLSAHASMCMHESISGNVKSSY